jgi:predicted nucleic acid-binding protein
VTDFVLDSSALLRYNDNEAGADRVEDIFTACAAGRARTWISAVQWGEVAGNLRKRFGQDTQNQTLEGLKHLGVGIVPVTAERAVRAAEFREDRKIAYADAFALELAMDSPNRILVTADYDFKAVDDLAQIEFLPVK